MSFNVQGAKGLTIPEGTVKTIHDKDNRLLWGAVGYNTKYAGDTFQQTIAGNNLFDRANAKENTLLKWLDAGDNTDTGSIVASNHIPVSEGDRYTSNYAMTLFFYDSSDKYIGVLLPDEISVGKSAGAYVKTFVVPSGYNIAKMCIEYRKGQGDPANPQDMVSIPDIMCNLGSSVLPYEPYVGGIPSPNPDYPQNIQVVTGEQTVKVTGKNMLEYSLASLQAANVGSGHVWNGNQETYNGVTFTVNDDLSITANGKATGGAAFFAINNNITLQPGTQYTMTGCPSGGSSTTYTLRIYANGSYTNETGSGVNFTYTTHDLVRINIPANSTVSNLTFKPMIRLRSVSDATYEPYQGQSYEINLGKNLFDSSTLYHGYYAINDGSKNANESYRTAIIDSLPAGTYTFSCDLADCRLLRWWGDGVSHDIGQDTNYYTLTTTTTGKFMLCFRNTSTTTITATVLCQLEAGTQVTPYASYFTPIELCGIGKKPDGTYTYQDYIWRDGSDWKVHKGIGKAILDGVDENWGLFSNGNAFYLTTSDVLTPESASSDDTKLIVANYYTADTYSNVYNARVDYGISLHASVQSQHRIILRNKDCADVPALKTWLASHNTIAYYARNAGSIADTTITDATLISQLNAIEEWMIRYGYVGTVFGSLPIVIDRTTA